MISNPEAMDPASLPLLAARPCLRLSISPTIIATALSAHFIGGRRGGLVLQRGKSRVNWTKFTLFPGKFITNVLASEASAKPYAYHRTIMTVIIILPALLVSPQITMPMAPQG
ncbi:hypothetical protein WAI453_001762 [Rhynchosporium graminicola]